MSPARGGQLAALVPDLSKVKDSTLEVKEGPAMLGTTVTYRALQKAAGSVRQAFAGLGLQDILCERRSPGRTSQVGAPPGRAGSRGR